MAHGMVAETCFAPNLGTLCQTILKKYMDIPTNINRKKVRGNNNISKVAKTAFFYL